MKLAGDRKEIEKIIGDIPIMLNTDYIKNRNKLK